VDGSIFMAVYAWPAGVSGLPHEYRVWAITGCVHGVSRERTFKLGTRSTGDFQLHAEREITLRPGSTIAFGEHEIHSVANPGESALVTVNVYGKNVSLFERREFDASRGVIRLLRGPQQDPPWQD